MPNSLGINIRHCDEDMVCLLDGGRKVRNATGGDMARACLVYVTGWDETYQRWLITKADNDAGATRATFVLRDAILNGYNGYAYKTFTHTGTLMTNLDTSGWGAVSDPVYLHATAGTITKDLPAVTKIQQIVGRVRVKSATVGVVEYDLTVHAPVTGTLEIPAGGVAGGDIADSVINSNHFSASGIPAGALGDSVVGSRAMSAAAIGSFQISASGVVGSNIADSVVGSRIISVGGVGSAQISSSGVSANNIANSVVGSRALSADAVQAANIADSQVSSEHMALSCIGSGQLVLSCVGSAQLGNDAVKAANISDSVVSSEHMALSCIGSAQLSADAVKAANISDSQVSSEHLALSCVGSAQLALGAIKPAQVNWVLPAYLGEPAVSSTNNIWTNSITLLSNSSGAGSSYAPQTQMNVARNLVYCLTPSTETAGDWTAGGVTVSGYDILRNVITETQAATALCTATAVHGLKCFGSVVHVSYNLSMADSLTAANTAGASLLIGGGSRIGFPNSIGAADAIVGLRIGTLPSSDFTVINSDIPYAAVQFGAVNITTPCFAQVVMSKL